MCWSDSGSLGREIAVVRNRRCNPHDGSWSFDPQTIFANEMLYQLSYTAGFESRIVRHSFGFASGEMRLRRGRHGRFSPMGMALPLFTSLPQLYRPPVNRRQTSCMRGGGLLHPAGVRAMKDAPSPWSSARARMKEVCRARA